MDSPLTHQVDDYGLGRVDSDPEETREWLDALDALLKNQGAERAHFLLEVLQQSARMAGAFIPFSPNTPYVNTIPVASEERSPGDHELEWKIRSLTRWNAMAMVVKANRSTDGIGGHIASYASSATLYDVGFNHFWRGPQHPDGQAGGHGNGSTARTRNPPPSRPPCSTVPPKTSTRSAMPSRPRPGW